MRDTCQEDEEEPRRKQRHYFDDLAYHFINGLEFFGNKNLPRPYQFSKQKYKDMYSYGAGIKQAENFEYPNAPRNKEFKG
jgi:hypothetical protein